jgi:hypothetical protein
LPTPEEPAADTAEKGAYFLGMDAGTGELMGPGGNVDAALITSCQAHEVSVEVHPPGDAKAYGALTNAIILTLKNNKTFFGNKKMTNADVVTEVRRILFGQRHGQNPCLECADGIVTRPFIC